MAKVEAMSDEEFLKFLESAGEMYVGGPVEKEVHIRILKLLVEINDRLRPKRLI